MCFKQFRQDKIQLSVHSHGDVVHTHWQQEGEKDHAHKPVFIGALHGLAGSAPALALIPAVSSGQLLLAMSYLLLFSLGVMLSMLAFGLGFGHLQRFLAMRYQQVHQFSRHVLASVSLLLGGFWLFQAI